jgi:cold shock CspA family protein
VGEHTRGAARKAAPARNTASGRPADRRGTPSAGRIVALYIGQSHGLIRLADARDVFFHRSDLRDGVSFNDLAVGDRVTFELLEDKVSGPRAVQVEPRPSRR